MRLLLTVILSVFLFTIPVFGQTEKPQTIIVPTGSLGEISELRTKMLEKTKSFKTLKSRLLAVERIASLLPTTLKN